MDLVRPCAVLIAVGLLGACGAPAATGNPPESVGGSGNYVDAVSSTLTIPYGDASEQFGVLTLPDASGPHPVVVLVHGGFWRAQYGLDLMEPLEADLVARGFATWNVEYRRVAQPGGGFPGTLEDVATAVDELASLAPGHSLDLERVAVVGHSAGGHLALWTGSRELLGAGDPGAAPQVRPRLVVGLAAVADLEGAAVDRLGSGATQDFIGGEPTALPEAYRVAQPVLDPDRTVLVHGSADTIVPVEQSLRFEAAGVQVVVIEGDDHFSVIDPDTSSWAATLDVLARM